VQILGPDGHLIETEDGTVSSTNARELVTPLLRPEQLAQGGYLIRWTALATEGGHTTQGTIGFDLGRSSTGLPGDVIIGPSTSNRLPQLDLLGGLSLLWQWLTLLAVLCWTGLLAMEYLLGQGKLLFSSVLTQVKQHPFQVQWLCLATLMLGEIVTLVLRTFQLTSARDSKNADLHTFAQLLFATHYGGFWLLRLVCLLVAAILLWWTVRLARQPSGKRMSAWWHHVLGRIAEAYGLTSAEQSNVPIHSTGPRPSSGVLLFLLGVILLTFALSADAIPTTLPPISTIALRWLSLAAQGLWFGSMFSH
jgi:hypothetical protein